MQRIDIGDRHAGERIEQHHHRAIGKQDAQGINRHLAAIWQTDTLAADDRHQDDQGNEVAEKHQFHGRDFARQFAHHPTRNRTDQRRHAHPEYAGRGPCFKHYANVSLSG